MNINKDLLFTFDYELFLGKKSGSVQNCMIKPTNELLSILNKYNIKGIFFVDCSCLHKLREKISFPKIKEDYDSIVNQICNLVKTGHYVFPHLHPHWLDAIYNESTNEWDLSNIEKYRLHSISEDLQVNYFKECLEILNDIIVAKDSKYKIDSYRAGGWCIQPFDVFEKIFKSCQIQNDFSVLGGFRKEGNALFFNYKDISTNAKPFKFQSSVEVENEMGVFNEYPISSVQYNKNNILNKIFNKILWKSTFGKIYGDGNAANTKLNIDEKVHDDLEMVSIELLTVFNLRYYKKFLVDNDYMQFISHPKMVSNHNLKMLNRFLKFSEKYYKINSDFKKIDFKT